MDYSFGRGDGVNRSYQEENKDDASSGNPLSSGAGGAGYAASRDLERGGGYGRPRSEQGRPPNESASRSLLSDL